MKKVGVVLVISLLFIFPLILTLISAQETPPGLPPQLGQDPEELTEQLKNKTQTKWDYLKQEWKTILLKNKYLGPVIRFSDKVLSPISKLLLGREISFSWVYFLTLAIWIVIIVLAYKPLKLGVNMNNYLAILSGIIIASLALRAIPTNWLEFQLTLMWKAIVIGVIILIIASNKILTDYLEETYKKEKEKIREFKAKTAEKIHDITIKSFGIKK